MHWLGGIALTALGVVGSIVLVNAIATRVGNTRPVGMWGAKAAA